MARIPSVEQTFFYARPPSRVFAALTEPKVLTTWFSQQAEVSLKKGGVFRLSWGRRFTMAGEVRAVDPPRRLDVTWVDRLEGGKVFKTRAEFRLRRKGGGTILTVTHRGFKKGKRWVALFGAVESGWAYYLTNLRSVLEHGVDLRSELDQLS